jgi:glycosyltransferase involved in cell wall biosynthesis
MVEEAKSKVGAVDELSVVLPAFNEEANIEKTVRTVASYLDGKPIDYEILVVNDGSADGTRAIAERLAAESPRVRALNHPQNRGYGAALRTGFDAACKRFVFYMDSDGQFDIRELDLLLPLATDENNIVTGYRMVRRDPFIRRLNAKLFGGTLVPLLLNVRVKDLNCAFKLIPRRVLQSIRLETSSALINAELYGRAVRRGYGIKEVGVHHFAREAGTQTGAHLSVIVKAFYDLFRLRQEILRTEKERT